MSPTKKEKFLCYTCLELFLAFSILFKLTMACYRFFHFFQSTTSQNVLTYKVTWNQLLKRRASVIVKRDSFLELQWEVKWYYKVGQVLKRRTIFITKWGVFLRILRNTYITKRLGRLQINRWKIWLDILIVNITYYYKRLLLIEVMKFYSSRSKLIISHLN